MQTQQGMTAAEGADSGLVILLVVVIVVLLCIILALVGCAARDSPCLSLFHLLLHSTPFAPGASMLCDVEQNGTNTHHKSTHPKSKMPRSLQLRQWHCRRRMAP